jgi:hypothetical protein
MLVTPSPVCLLIVIFEFGKIAVLAMVLLGVRAIRLIFMIVPLVIVVVLFVVVADSSLVIFGAQRYGRHCYWGYKGGTKQGRIQETGHDWIILLPAIEQFWYQAVADPAGRTQRIEYKDDQYLLSRVSPWLRHRPSAVLHANMSVPAVAGNAGNFAARHKEWSAPGRQSEPRP